jgi:hypothetical protein
LECGGAVEAAAGGCEVDTRRIRLVRFGGWVVDDGYICGQAVPRAREQLYRDWQSMQVLFAYSHTVLAQVAVSADVKNAQPSVGHTLPVKREAIFIDVIACQPSGFTTTEVEIAQAGNVINNMGVGGVARIIDHTVVPLRQGGWCSRDDSVKPPAPVSSRGCAAVWTSALEVVA